MPGVELGWTKTDAATICQARTDGAVAQLRAHPRRRAGRASSGPTSCSPGPSSRCARRAAALYAGQRRARRPRRPARPRCGGAATCCASTAATATSRRGSSAGLDATEIGLLTELYWGLPLRTYSRTRAWTDEQFDAATERLESRGLIADGAFTDAGRDAARGRSRCDTDVQMRAGARRPRRRRRRAVRHPRPVGRGDPRRQGLPGLRAPRPRRRLAAADDGTDRPDAAWRQPRRVNTGWRAVACCSMEHVAGRAELAAATRPCCSPSPGGTTPATPRRRRVRTLVERWGATAVAEIDPEPFTDFATIRPHVRHQRRPRARSCGRRSGCGRRRCPAATCCSCSGPSRRCAGGCSASSSSASPSSSARRWRSASAPCSPTCRTPARCRSSARPATPS